MSVISQKELEELFRNSSSPDELLDAFGIAIKEKYSSSPLYKLLLRNKTLSNDEILMYAEKICKDFPELKYDIYFNTAYVLFSKSLLGEEHLTAFKYYKNASMAAKEKAEPYLSVIRMYNKELNIPRLADITQFVKEGINYVEKKSSLCFELAKLYKSKGDIVSFRELQSDGESFQKQGM